MRQPTIDEAARIIDAGDAMAELLRDLIARFGAIVTTDAMSRLIDAWRDATRQVAP